MARQNVRIMAFQASAATPLPTLIAKTEHVKEIFAGCAQRKLAADGLNVSVAIDSSVSRLRFFGEFLATFETTDPASELLLADRARFQAFVRSLVYPTQLFSRINSITSDGELDDLKVAQVVDNPDTECGEVASLLAGISYKDFVLQMAEADQYFGHAPAEILSTPFSPHAA
jgi:hypothetical protein